MTTASRSIVATNIGVLSFKRITVSNQFQQIAIPLKASAMTLKNLGPVDVQLKAAADTVDNYWTLEMSDAPLRVGLNDSVNLQIKTNAGPATLQIMFWG